MYSFPIAFNEPSHYNVSFPNQTILMKDRVDWYLSEAAVLATEHNFEFYTTACILVTGNHLSYFSSANCDLVIGKKIKIFKTYYILMYLFRQKSC